MVSELQDGKIVAKTSSNVRSTFAGMSITASLLYLYTPVDTQLYLRLQVRPHPANPSVLVAYAVV